MNIGTLAVACAAGLVMTPIGPVSTICVRRALVYGRHGGIVAGAGDAFAVATYASIGVTGSTLLPRLFARFANVWHIAITVALVTVSVLIWLNRACSVFMLTGALVSIVSLAKSAP